MLHHERGPHRGIRAVAFGAVHLDHDSQGSGKRPDERRRFGDRGHERVAEWDLRHADLHLVVRPQEAQRLERMDCALEFRIDVVLVIDPSDGLAEAGWQSEDLFVPEPVDTSFPDWRRERILLLAARGFLFADVLPVPDDRIGEGCADEHLAGVEREPVRRFSPVAALRIRIRSILLKRSADTRAITLEIPGSDPIDTIALIPRSRQLESNPSCSRTPRLSRATGGLYPALST